jgi:hypothetical protein
MTWGAARAEPEPLDVVEPSERGDVLEVLERPEVVVEWAPEGVPDAPQLTNKAVEADSAMDVRTRLLARRARGRVPFGASRATRISRSPP